MTWLVENWSLLVVIIAAGVVAGISIKHFMGMPTEEQIKNIKEWLLYAVIEAEKELGDGTGKLKLRQVYDAFVTKFPWAAKTVPFELFSQWVDEVLVAMKDLLHNNGDVLLYTKGISS